MSDIIARLLQNGDERVKHGSELPSRPRIPVEKRGMSLSFLREWVEALKAHALDTAETLVIHSSEIVQS